MSKLFEVHGLQVQRTRVGVILSASLLSGAVTAFCGPIGFLGVAVPHLCRSLFNTADHRVLVPTSMLLGATLARRFRSEPLEFITEVCRTYGDLAYFRMGPLRAYIVNHPQLIRCKNCPNPNVRLLTQQQGYAPNDACALQ